MVNQLKRRWLKIRNGRVLVLSALFACGEKPAVDADPTRIDRVIMVSMDTTRADRMGGPFGNTRGLTPNLDAFAADSVSFTNTWAVANLTSMSHAAIFTSRYPSELGRSGGEFHLDGTVPTLAGILGLYGWHTAAITSGAHLTRQFGLDRDFAWFQHTPLQGSLWHTVPASLGWFDANKEDKSTFMFVHGYDGHTPYMAPAPFGRAWTDREYVSGAGIVATATPFAVEMVFGANLFLTNRMRGFLVSRNRPRLWDVDAQIAVEEAAALAAHNRGDEVMAFAEPDRQYVSDIYDGAMAYQDAMFGEFVAGLKSRNLYDHSVIIVLSDHGESLGEAGRFGHGEALAKRELHVPLYVRIPGGEGRTVDARVSLLDVLPTVLELVGATLPAGARGSSLVPWLRSETGPDHQLRFAEGNLAQQMVEDADGQLIVEGLRSESPYYYDIISAADLAGPAFQGVGAAEPALARAPYRDSLLGWQTSLERPSFVAPASSAAVEEMKKHGYFTP